jgi:Putative Ig domain
MCPAQRCSIAAVRRTSRLTIVLTLACLAACGEDEAEDETGSGTNTAPTIGGSAPQVAQVGVPYSFQPSASDADGDTLQFSATGLPAWASINASTGRINGTPEAGEEGATGQIRISVSDGDASATLAPFTINVMQTATGSAVLSWLPPTDNCDGSVLTNLAGYRIEYGRTPGAFDRSIDIDNPSINTYVIEQLAPGTWYFSVIARNSGDIESERSDLGSKVIS